MVERSHLSIGEVLNLLQEEFPDVTISKIRFLESQGLLDPERTPSGYRKFYDADIERLRWILRQQKENFLPLKVIKDRLAAGELGEPVGAGKASARAGSPAGTGRSAPSSSRAATPGPAPDEAPAEETGPRDRSPDPSRPARKRRNGSQASLLDAGETAVSMSLDELVSATGLTPRVIGELERFGLLASRTLGATSYYDEDALVVGRLAASFLRYGVEPRHLRMYKVAAERESGVFEQLILPLLKQRNPQSRRQALEVLEELAQLGEQLRAAMLRHALREYLGQS
ncbi:transcriptional regulator FtsR [Rhabdothermincola sediminis]|uniref:transcriptional regulator FtsR n=1 Tax=Rhabdothermincola sediminis TaxID=2751370 RepID=UPI001AA042AD|nr:MerR family transcriptional regulator [Rhabdothermincola sediminis]